MVMVDTRVRIARLIVESGAVTADLTINQSSRSTVAVVVVSKSLGAGKCTPSPFDLSAKECHNPDPAHQIIVPGKCPSIPEDEQENQGESRNRGTESQHS
ncbi:hypothetical protein TNCV_4500811 [Trichonephila clavipes]|nr:hypothetical protein TNCV_4500811 [Trichonephila clavipes]